MEFIMQFSNGLLKGFTAEFMGKILGYGIGGVVSFWILKKFRIIWAFISAPFTNSMKVQRTRNAVTDEKGLWLAVPLKKQTIEKPSSPIILVANLKGGVGKTTLTANLTAHCAAYKKEKTLCIDFDYQGSLTSMAYPDYRANTIEDSNSKAGRLIGGNFEEGMSVREAVLLPFQPDALQDFPRIKFIPADYPLAQVENRLMVRWLLNDLDFDVRTRLAKEFQRTPFDRILIDAPPRLTTSSIQGLYASTHIIIPTILDRLTTQAVGRFVEQIYELRRSGLCPFLERITVVGTIVNLNSGTDKDEHQFLELVLNKYSDLVDLVPFELSIPDRSVFAKRAGHEIAYLVDSHAQENRSVREIFDKLGNHIWK